MIPINNKTEIPLNYSERQASKFSRLNDKEINTGILGKIRQFLGKILYNPTLKWQTHMQAEHMSRGLLNGNSHHIAIAKTVEVLEEMDHPPKDLIKALNYADSFAKAQLFVDPFLEVTLIGGLAGGVVKANIIKNDIKNLKEGESLAIPSSCERHAMLLFITRQENGNFKVVQHNQGLGIGKFHFSKVDASGKKIFQTALEIEDVGEEHLCGVSSLFIDRVIINSNPLTGGTVNHLYLNLLPLLKGHIKYPPSEDPRLWGHGQLGGSCTAASGLSLIRSQMDENSFKEFRDIGRTEMLLKSYKQIKKGWGNNATQRSVTLEVVRKLEHSLSKRGLDLPLEMQELKRQLEGINKAPIIDKKPIISDNLTDNIDFAFTLLKEGNFDDASLEKARPYIEKALIASQLPASKEELNRLWELSSQLRSYSRNKSLTVNQIYMMTIISTALLDKVDSSKEWISPSDKNDTKVLKFCESMHNRYNALSLGSRFQNGAYEPYLAHHQKKFIEPVDLLTPKNLAKLLEKMGNARYDYYSKKLEKQ